MKGDTESEEEEPEEQAQQPTHSIEDFNTFDKAWTSIKSLLPSNLLSSGASYTLGDKVQALVILVCGLTIAYEFELKSQGMQLLDFG